MGWFNHQLVLFGREEHHLFFFILPFVRILKRAQIRFGNAYFVSEFSGIVWYLLHVLKHTSCFRWKNISAKVSDIKTGGTVRLFLGGVSLTKALHTAYIGEYLSFRYRKKIDEYWVNSTKKSKSFIFVSKTYTGCQDHWRKRLGYYVFKRCLPVCWGA